MTEAEKLDELAVRAEQATGPDRAIDAEIEVAVAGFPERAYQQKNGMRPKDAPALDRMEWLQSWGVLRFTASVDAAMTLVPNGHQWGVQGFDGAAPAIGWIGKDWIIRNAATPALALCAAALRSRAKGSQL